MREMYPSGRFEKIRIKLSQDKVRDLMAAYARGEITEDGRNVYDMQVEYLTAHRWIPVTHGFISPRESNPWELKGSCTIFYVEKNKIKYLVNNEKRYIVTKRVEKDLLPDIVEYARQIKRRRK